MNEVKLIHENVFTYAFNIIRRTTLINLLQHISALHLSVSANISRIYMYITHACFVGLGQGVKGESLFNVLLQKLLS